VGAGLFPPYLTYTNGKFSIQAIGPNGKRGTLAVGGLQHGTMNGRYLRWFEGSYKDCAPPGCTFYVSPVPGSNVGYKGVVKIEAIAPDGTHGVLAVWGFHHRPRDGLPIRWFSGGYDNCAKPSCDFRIYSLGNGKVTITAAGSRGSDKGALAVWGLQKGAKNGRYVRWYRGGYNTCAKPSCTFEMRSLEGNDASERQRKQAALASRAAAAAARAERQMKEIMHKKNENRSKQSHNKRESTQKQEQRDKWRGDAALPEQVDVMRGNVRGLEPPSARMPQSRSSPGQVHPLPNFPLTRLPRPPPYQRPPHIPFNPPQPPRHSIPSATLAAADVAIQEAVQQSQHVSHVLGGMVGQGNPTPRSPGASSKSE